MREVHGVADCEKVQAVNEKGHYPVTVTDGHGVVILSIAGMTYPAGMTPDRARFIAEQIHASAKRVEDQAKVKKLNAPV